MKIPCFSGPAAIPDYTPLPALAVTVNGGFLSQCVALARFGTTSKSSHVYALLDYTARHNVWRDYKIEGLHERIPSDLDRLAILRPDGRAGSWLNGESLWVSIEWLAMACGAPLKGDGVCFSVRMTGALVQKILSGSP